jgi:hypothetical protein
MTDIDLTEEEMRDMVNIKLTEIYPKLQKDFKRITSYNSAQFEDLLMFCIHEFLSKKPIRYQFKVAVTDNALPNYFGRSMSLNLRSSSSPFWHQYRKEGYNSRGTYLAETDSKLIQGEYDEIQDMLSPATEVDPYECMMSAISKLDFYHQPLLTDYYLNGLTYNQMNKKYGIAIRHLRIAVEESIQQLQESCKHFINK